MRNKFFLALMVATLVWHLPFSIAQANMPQVSHKIEQIVKTNPNLKGALVGISVRSAKTGELLYTKNADSLMRPASNLKLLTAAVALTKLGEDFSFQTEISTDGKIKKKVLHGDLFIQGKGDPTLLESDIEKIVKKIREMGIEAIDGDVIGDDSWYDDTRYSIDLPWSDETFSYGSAISALTVSPDHDYDAGSVIIKITPNKKIGKQAHIQIEPNTDYVKVINQTNTVSEEEEGTDVTFQRDHGRNTIVVQGDIDVGAKELTETVAVWEPTNYALAIFKKVLQENGIEIYGNVKRGLTPKKTDRIAVHQSIPLSELLIPFMKLSNNGHAETLVKEMGKVMCEDGSWEKGLEVVQKELGNLGLNPEEMLMRDGSGISHVNLVTPNQITHLLYTIQKYDWFSIYLDSLPVAGGSDRIERGTLYSRMSQTEASGNVRAKTGTISSVSALSGYLDTQSGDTLIFSIMLNHVLDGKQAKQVEDDIILQLVQL